MSPVQAPNAILPLRATPDEKNKIFSRTPSPAARPSVAPHTQEFGGGYPYSPDFDDYGDDAAYGAQLLSEYNAGWE